MLKKQLIFILLIGTILSQQQIPSDVINAYQQKKLKQNIKQPFMGMKNSQTQEDIPLKQINYEVDIIDSISEVKIIQEYKNTFAQNIEAEYFFAISNKAAFTEIEVNIDGKITRGFIKEKEKARQEYNDAIKQGKRAIYAEIVPEVHDIMKLKIGNIEPQSTAIVTLKYLETLDVVMNKFWRFQISNTFSQRSLQNQNYSQDMIQISNPQTIPSCDEQTYSMDIKLNIKSESPIYFLDSPSHPFISDYSQDKKQVSIALDTSHSQFTPNKEFIILFRNEEINKPHIILEKDPFSGTYAGLLTFFPDFNSDNIKSAYQRFKEKFLAGNIQDNDFNFNESHARGEYIFIVDRSGSMMGDRIVMTKQVLDKLIDLLPEDSYFNIVSFGSEYKKMFQKSAKKIQENLNYAKSEISKFEADLGGTEIYNPLMDTMTEDVINNYPKSIFLITDGQVHNENSIVQLVSQQASNKNLRVYTVGVGNGVSKNLITQIAEEGQGKYELIAETSELDARMKYLVKDSVTPFLSQFFLNLNDSQVSNMAPTINAIKSIRKNEPLQLFIFFLPDLKSTKITLDCYDSTLGQNKSFPIKIDPSQSISGSKIHKLGAHRMIKQVLNNILFNQDPLKNLILQDEANYYKYLIDISLKHQVLSELTAFILIDDTPPLVNVIPPKKVIVPLIQSIDYESNQINLEAAQDLSDNFKDIQFKISGQQIDQQSGSILKYELMAFLLLMILFSLG